MFLPKCVDVSEIICTFLDLATYFAGCDATFAKWVPNMLQRFVVILIYYMYMYVQRGWSARQWTTTCLVWRTWWYLENQHQGGNNEFEEGYWIISKCTQDRNASIYWKDCWRGMYNMFLKLCIMYAYRIARVSIVDYKNIYLLYAAVPHSMFAAKPWILVSSFLWQW